MLIKLCASIIWFVSSTAAFQKGLTNMLPSISQSRKKAGTAIYSSLPKLIVFDLDNTLWTPELYQLRKLQRQNINPRAGKDVKLMDGTQKVFDEYVPKLKKEGVQFAIASRTNSVEWAHSLIGQFGILDAMTCVEIFPGNKKQHFSNIQKATGFNYEDMLFFDDARDGRWGNCEPVSELGVLSVHCPNGIDTLEVFTSALDKYQNEWNRSPNHIVEWDGRITNLAKQSVMKGKVISVKQDKNYGFIQYENEGSGRKATNDIFFHFSGLSNRNDPIEEGDEVSFLIQKDPKSGKTRAGKVELINQSNDKNTVQLRAFSMNQPFAALLANGYKTLETRNGTMFTPYPEGTQMLLHVGKRTYPDGNKHIDVMKSGGLDDKEIEELKRLPKGYGRGDIVAILEIGKTYETTLEERSDPDFQRNVAAYGADSGKMITEIKRVDYLKKPVKLSGKGGVFKVKIDPEVIPDGWKNPYAPKNNGKNKEEPNVYAIISG